WEIIKKYVELGLGLSIVTSVSLTGNEKLIAKPLSKYFHDYYYGVTMKRKGSLSLPAKNFIELIDPSFFRGR
nr:LysR family transcriptional regulator [Rhodospirillales bacterium]